VPFWGTRLGEESTFVLKLPVCPTDEH
jgi:hypothetical protein